MDPTDSPFFSTINGMFSSSSSSSPAAAAADVLFSRASAAPAPVPVPTEPVRRKRGRPRKYGLSPSKPPAGPPLVKRDSASFRKIAQLGALGNAGQGFTPHVITVPAGEDVAQKIMSFAQLREKAVCILSCSGSISNASLSQPLGDNITYEGRFEILSLSGSFLNTETTGESSRTGGMSVCLSGTDGHIVGGGVGGPLIAAGLVQVIVGSFSLDMNNDLLPSKTIDASTNLQSPVPAGSPILSPTTFRSVESSGRITSSRGSDDRQSLGGSGSNNHILQSRPLNMMSSRMPSDWRIGRYYSSVHNGETGLSPEKDDEFHIQD